MMHFEEYTNILPNEMIFSTLYIHIIYTEIVRMIRVKILATHMFFVKYATIIFFLSTDHWFKHILLKRKELDVA